MRKAQARTKAVLAIDGGKPIRKQPLPYGRQQIDQTDIAAVVKALKSDWLTSGPTVAKFESEFAKKMGAAFAVSFCNGTAALHAAMAVAGIGPGDEVIVPAITFIATSNAAIYLGGVPVFADVQPSTLLIDPNEVIKKLTPRTRAIVAVDYAGQPCDYDSLNAIAEKNNLILISDACHAVGAKFRKKSVGSIATLTTFSFHPVKQITTGEGGMVTTNHPELARRLRMFRGHGIGSDFRERFTKGQFTYEMETLGFNYRLTEIQSALGLSQLKRLAHFLKLRKRIAVAYDRAFSKFPAVIPLATSTKVDHAHHLYVIKLNPAAWKVKRDQVLAALRAEGIGANLHYQPIYQHPFYRERGYAPNICPIADREFLTLISLPLHQSMTLKDAKDVVDALLKIYAVYGAES